ncbi:hypothetical protein V6N11_073373 [Hibiscus sabdariffa]|uniref:Uncharacterized protein n=1 Tax=Hibiscus sabdariffa TaxID=183260 RepID=A0ABR2P4B5_9ROSI
MSRIVVFFFTVICLVLTATHDRFIVPEQTVSLEETVTIFPKPDHIISNLIYLPSEKTYFEQDTAVDSKNYDTLEFDSDLDSFLLTMIGFRPVNDHFPREQLIPFHHKHDCHFHKDTSLNKIRKTNTTAVTTTTTAATVEERKTKGGRLKGGRGLVKRH